MNRYEGLVAAKICLVIGCLFLFFTFQNRASWAFSTGSSCSGGGTSWSSSCDEGGWSCGGTFCNMGTGEKRLAMGILTTTDSGMVPYDIRVSIESNEVVLTRDTVVTSYFQTEAFYRGQLRAKDTWTGFSSPGLVYVTDPPTVLVTFYTVSIYNAENNPTETSSMVFGFVPHTYSDSGDIRDSMQMNFHMREAPGYPYRKIVQNDFVATSGGRKVSPAPQVIASDPVGETFPQIFYPAGGDLIITEIMKDPDNGVGDATGEWFEVLNASNVWLDLGQLVIRDNGSDFFSPYVFNNREDALLVGPGKTFVFGKARDVRLNGGAKVVAAYGGAFTLANGSDEIILEVNGVGEIDRVDYTTSGWPNPTGKSMMLTDTTLDNNNGANWIASTIVYGNQNQKGTPNSPNTVQSDTPVFPPSSRGPAAGDIVVTEFLSNAIGLDQNGEWFEIFNRTDNPLTLTNLTVEFEDSTGVKTTFKINDETILDPNRYFVLSRDGNVSHGFVFDYDYPDNVSMSNDKGAIRIKDDTGTVIDVVSYDGDHFVGFPDFGNGVNGGWPVPSEFDGRAAALQGTLANLRDPNYDNNNKNNWAPASNLERYGSGGSYKGRGGFGTPRRANVYELPLTVSMPSSINSNTTTETFSVTITPSGGWTVGDVDTQSIRLYRTHRPYFLKIDATNIRADFRSYEAPPTVERNKSAAAEITALRNADTPQAFLGSGTMTVNDNRFPTPGTVQSAAAGDLLITEVMVNGPGDENLTEYFEVHNKTTKTIDLAALGIQDGGGTTGDQAPEATSRIYNPNGPYPFRIEPGQYKVIGRAGNRIQIGGYDLDGIYMNQDLNFSNSGDELVVFRTADNTLICQMEYNTTLGFPKQDVTAADNRSLSFVDTTVSATQGKNWVNAGIPYGDSGHGTPGGQNRIARRSGDVLVSEVYANPPPGGEPNAEFFEAVNPDTVNPIDLSGLIVSDDNGNTFAIDDYPGKIVGGGKQKVHIPAGGAFVFGNSRSASDGVDNTFDDTFGPGVTSYDYPNSWTLLNTSPGDAVRLVRQYAGGDSREIHGMTYSSAPAGESWELDNLSDSLTYSLKTPSPTVKPAP